MIPLSIDEIADMVDGRVAGAERATIVTDVVVDSRAAGPGAMYVAIVGERADGHDFAAAAVESGCVVVLCSRELVGPHGPLPCIVVDDPVLALGRLAARVRRDRLTAKVVAITGSSGKTTTKDLLASVLASAGPTVSPLGSFNTEVGLPLTVLSADEGTEFLVVEMGMRGLGHIGYLVDIADPDVGVVLNVGSAHLGMLGSREAIADAKAELVAGLRPSATAVLNADDPLVRTMSAATPAAVVTFGESADAIVRALDVRLDERARASFVLTDTRGGRDASARVALQLVGEHNVSNALAVAATALSLGVPLAEIALALSEATSVSRWRMEIMDAPGGYTVINDAYNANPESMRAALKTLAALSVGRRSWAVLGEMRELGATSQDEHDAIGRLAVRLDISRLVCVGEGTRVMYLGAANEGSWSDEAAHVPSIQAAIDLLQAEVRPGDVVLVKASRSVGMEVVAQAILDGGAA